MAQTVASPQPALAANSTGFDAAGAVRKRRAAKRRPAASARPVAVPPRQAAGRGAAPQFAARAAYADAYRSADALPRRPPPPPDQDAFEPTGVRVGSFLLRPSIDVVRGYDSDPARVLGGTGSAFTVVAPELQGRSLWSRDELAFSLRGSYTAYDQASSLNRPLVDAKVAHRIDMSRDTQFNLDSRFFLSTDYPGSPNLPADLAKLPIYMTFGLGAGVTQRFNRLELMASGIAESTWYQDSELTDGSTSSNRDRDYRQFGGQLRASYELMPGVRPFVEIGGDIRRHELPVDRNGEQRDFERDHAQARLELPAEQQAHRRVRGRLPRAALSGPDACRHPRARVRRIAQVGRNRLDHGHARGHFARGGIGAGRRLGRAPTRRRPADRPHLPRWLIGTLKFGYGNDQYVGLGRIDNRTSLGAAITYKLNREFWLKGEYRRESLRSNAPDVNYDANIFLVGLKLQR